MILRPVHVNRLGVLAEVFVAEEDRLREVNGQQLFLADDSGRVVMTENIPMDRYTPETLQAIADEYARAAAFLRSVTTG